MPGRSVLPRKTKAYRLATYRLAQRPQLASVVGLDKSESFSDFDHPLTTSAMSLGWLCSPITSRPTLRPVYLSDLNFSDSADLYQSENLNIASAHFNASLRAL